jgi:hypothetical protein
LRNGPRGSGVGALFFVAVEIEADSNALVASSVKRLKDGTRTRMDRRRRLGSFE